MVFHAFLTSTRPSPSNLLSLSLPPRPVPLLPSPGAAPLHLQPGVIHRRRHGGADGGGADIADDAEGLLQGEVHPQHLVAVLRLLLRLLHQRVLVATGVQLSQQLGVDEVFRLSHKGKREIMGT